MITRQWTLGLLPAVTLTLGLGLSACESQLDDKPSATVTEVSAEEAPADKAAAPEADKAGAKQALVLDKAASKIEFVGAKVTDDHRGGFGSYTGSLQLADDGSVKALNVSVDTASVSIEPGKLAKHLKSPDFFDVAKFPKAEFTLTKFEKAAQGESTHTVSGQLNLHGVTKAISFPAKVEMADGKAAAKAEFKIQRKDFGIVYPGMPDDLIKDEVLLDLDLHFHKGS